MDIESEIKRICDERMSVVNKIFDMFVMYYGESNVDLIGTDIIDVIKQAIQIEFSGKEDEITDDVINVKLDAFLSSHRFDIVIYWPDLTLTNENYNTVDIHDFFCKITIDISGRLRDIRFVKSTYTNIQFDLGYRHSHLRSVCLYEGNDDSTFEHNARRLQQFDDFCFGTGPIRDTLSTLRYPDNNDGIENTYLLLCRELDICVRIESLNGVPYFPMSRLTRGETLYEPEKSVIVENVLFKEFIRHFLENIDLDYVFNNGSYDIGCSFDEFSIYATKAFIEYVKNNPDKFYADSLKRMFCVVVKKNGRFYIDNNRSINKFAGFKRYATENPIPIIRFKDRQFYLKIVDNSNEDEQPHMRLLTKDLVSYMYDLILLMINSKIDFTKDGTNNLEQQSNGGEEISDEHAQVHYGFCA